MSSNPFARTIAGAGGGSRPTHVWRGDLDNDGNPIYQEIEWDNGKYVVPNSGQYTLAVVGYTEPQIDHTYPNSQGEYVNKFALELEIVSERGKGFRFLWSFQTPKITFSFVKDGKKISPSNLGRIWTAAVGNGVEPEKGTETGFDDMLGKPFDAYVVASTEKNDKGLPKHAKVTADTIAPASIGENAGPDPFAEAMKAA